MSSLTATVAPTMPSTQTPRSVEHTASSNAIQDIAELSAMLKACGDPLRLQILQVLKSDTFGVLELTQMFETKQSGMSHHLKVLNKVGLVETQREGNAIFYRRPFQRTKQEQALLARVFELVDMSPVSPALANKVSEVGQQRSLQSQAFFEKYAEHLSEQQELIADHEQYAQASFDLLQKLELPLDSEVLELGPGEGLFLKRLALNYERVVALDTSAQMIEHAGSFAKAEGLGNIDFVLGDTGTLKRQGRKVDAIVANMVLHHVPTPHYIFEDCSALLRAGGGLVVCDLTHHDQDWTKERCGDVWLGFESDELKHWASSNGFKDKESVFIGLRNGFQIQLHSFIKL